MAEIVAVVGLVSSLASGALTAVGAIQQGNAAKAEAQFKAEQLRAKAKEEVAAGQRRMFAERRKKDLALSTLQARAASSGAGATDETVIGLGGSIAEEGELQALSEFYLGENRARGYEDQANAAIMEGRAAARASRLKAAGSIFSTATSVFEKFAPGGSLSKSFGYG